MKEIAGLVKPFAMGTDYEFMNFSFEYESRAFINQG